VRKLIDTTSPDAGDDVTTSRSDLKRARRAREDALSQLAAELSALDDKRLQRLELPESVLDAIHEVRRIESLRARARQLRVVRSALRDASWPAIRAQLDQLVVHGKVGPVSVAISPPSDAQAREWVVRLLGEGRKALDELMAAYPTADRKYLSQLSQAAASGSPERRKRAELKLVRALRSLLI
jgi:ribosome-associated protein